MKELSNDHQDFQGQHWLPMSFKVSTLPMSFKVSTLPMSFKVSTLPMSVKDREPQSRTLSRVIRAPAGAPSVSTCITSFSVTCGQAVERGSQSPSDPKELNLGPFRPSRLEQKMQNRMSGIPCYIHLWWGEEAHGRSRYNVP